MTTFASANTIILGYNDVSLSCGFQAAPCQELAGVSGSALTGSGGLAQPGLYQGFGVHVGTKMTFSETGYSGEIGSLTFDEFNNDCQNGGGYNCTDGTTWDVTESLNGGAASSILTFGSGTPAFTNFPFSVGLNQSVAASDNVAFTFTVTSVDPNHVGTSAIGFRNIDLNGPSSASVPEPGSLTMLATGAFGLAGFLRRRFQSSAS